MKVGIVTFHRALNYGALLQAFALRYSLEKIGAEAHLIDYHNPVIEKMYNYPTFFQRKNIKEKIKFILQGSSEKERREKFEIYRKKYLNLSSTVYTPNNITTASDQFDKFIVGSDQVWNYDAHNFDENFFLSFVNDSTKKYSYAASFGISSLPDNYKDKYRTLLNDFVMCSVREKQGLSILNELGITSNRIDLDPTMLLTKDEWITLFNIKPKNRKKYIFAYYFELTPTLKAYVESLAKHTCCPVVYLGNPVKSPFRCKCRALKTADPVDFVRTIANAEYVATNSFHGTALSIIFNKNFSVELLKQDSKVNSRLENVLKTFNLENRIIGNSVLANDINWNSVNTEMSKMRIRSQMYLEELIK